MGGGGRENHCVLDINSRFTDREGFCASVRTCEVAISSLYKVNECADKVGTGFHAGNPKKTWAVNAGSVSTFYINLGLRIAVIDFNIDAAFFRAIVSDRSANTDLSRCTCGGRLLGVSWVGVARENKKQATQPCYFQ